MRSRSGKVVAVVVLVVVALSAGCATMGLVETIESLLNKIKELLTAKKWDEALIRVAEVIRRDPTQWRAYLYGAQAYIGKAEWGQALTHARKVFEMAPRESETLTTLGEALLGAGTAALQRRAFGDAASHFVEYIKLRPADAQGYLNAGRAFLGLGNWGEAARVLVEGLGRASDPATRSQLVQGLLEGGRQALARGEYRGATSLLREYVRQDPANVAAYLDLGKAYWGSGERAEALGAFRRVLELAPQNEEARRFLFGR
ncbi:MAG: tetratricopeptide repeat protein [Candidatus Rokubacteria bacterium]|nr:tetratricopeptide repeat protein [Candidatus Rokubacteria bacterium]